MLCKEFIVPVRDLEVTHTPGLWEKIWDRNILLTPEALGEFIPSYKEFQQIPENSLLWSETGSIIPIHNMPVIVGLYGPTSAGKDALAASITLPYLRIISTTSRSIRPEDPKDTELYHFRTVQEMNELIDKGEFLEGMWEVSGFYGTTKEEIEMKIQKAKTEHIPLLIWRANIQGHGVFKPKVQECFGLHVPGIFILPRMPIQEYQRHIMEKRGIQEGLKRWHTACAEIEHAPSIVDYLLINPFDQEDGEKQSAKALHHLLSHVCPRE